ncbi:MAG: hypothetical protein JZU47_10280 [Prolixibacteraceae bacterium]|nr:hypothetical protein [Prolixibacteraceae bacterium]
MPEKFIVSIPVKPYVKRFLSINFGDPADFTTDPDTNRFFLNLLKKPNTSRDKQYPEQICTYTETAEVFISQHDFYRYGWELTRTDIVAFGKRFEDRAKCLMRSFVGVYVAMGMPPFISIARFQEKFQFDENSWQYETIKKDFYRNGMKEPLDFNGEIFNKIEKIVLHNLYELGTISKRAKKEYEATE